MKRALNDSQGRSGSEQSAQAERALQQLNEAIRGMTQSREDAVKEGLGQAVNDSGSLVKQQEKILINFMHP